MVKLFIDLILIFFSAWTLGFHITLFTRIPYFWAGIIGLIMSLIFLYLYFIQFKEPTLNIFKPNRKDLPHLVFIALIAVSLGLFSAMAVGTDADNIGFFYNPFIQSTHLRSPVFLTNQGTLYSPELPALSGPHILISLEQLITLFGRLSGIPAGIVYHTIFPFFAGIFIVLCFYYIFTTLGLKRWQVGIAILTTILFMYISGYGAQWGVWLLSRSYRGKGLITGTFAPVYMMSLYEYLQNPKLKNFFILFLFGIAFVGMTTTGTFYIPIMIFSMSVSYIILNGFSKQHLKRVILLVASGTYAILTALSIITEIIPVTYIKNWNSSVTETWYTSIVSRFLPNDIITMAFGLLLFVVPLLSSQQNWGKILSLYSLVLIFLFANSILGPLLIRFATLPNQWRTFYLLPIPIFVGLLPSLMLKGIRDLNSNNITRFIVAIFVVFVICIGSTSKTSIEWKKNIFDYKLNPLYQVFLEEYPIRKFSNKTILSTDNITVALTLIDPTIHYYSDRLLYSQSFAEAFNDPKLKTRAFFQAGLMRCDITWITFLPNTIEYFLSTPVDYILYDNCNNDFTQQLINLLDNYGSSWKTNQNIYSNVDGENLVVWVLKK